MPKPKMNANIQSADQVQKSKDGSDERFTESIMFSDSPPPNKHQGVRERWEVGGRELVKRKCHHGDDVKLRRDIQAVSPLVLKTKTNSSDKTKYFTDLSAKTVKVFDKQSGRAFYWNQETNEMK